jgi:hypothetical protein
LAPKKDPESIFVQFARYEEVKIRRGFFKRLRQKTPPLEKK